MNRKGFLRRLIAGVIIAPVLPQVIANATEPEPMQALFNDVEKHLNDGTCKWNPRGTLKLDGKIQGQHAHVTIYDDLVQEPGALWDDCYEKMLARNGNVHRNVQESFMSFGDVNKKVNKYLES